MPFSIDSTTYPKSRTYRVGHGYGLRPSPPTSIVVHSTNNGKVTSFESEADYLYRSADVSADFLIGKDDRIVQFLDSRRYQAWHAGGRQANGAWTAQPDFANPASIGIELHKSLPDPFYPQAQLDALAWLLKGLASQHGIPPHMIDTHGQIAIAGPYVRKHDPHMWQHADFIAWRDALFVADPLRAKTLPGAPPESAAIYCSAGAFAFYAARGGLPQCGYPLRHMFRDESMDCAVLVCERVIIKESSAFGVEQALLAEAEAEEWI